MKLCGTRCTLLHHHSCPLPSLCFHPPVPTRCFLKSTDLCTKSTTQIQPTTHTPPVYPLLTHQSEIHSHNIPTPTHTMSSSQDSSSSNADHQQQPLIPNHSISPLITNTTKPFNTPSSTKLLQSDLANALLKGFFSDCRIKLKERFFNAHRVVLATRSKFFEDLLLTSQQQQDPQHTTLPVQIDLNQLLTNDIANVEPESFSIILHYLYSGQLYITHANCLDIYSLSRILKLDSAEKVCNEFLDKMKQGSEVCGLLKAALERNEDELYDQCMKSFEEKTAECLESDMFLTVPQQVIDSVLRSEKITCTEKNLFDAIIRWWGANKDDILPDASKTQQDQYLLDNYLYYIRYPLMESAEVIEIEKMHLIPEDYILQALRLHACQEEMDASAITQEQQRAIEEDEDIYSNEEFRTRTRTESLVTFTFSPDSKGADMNLSSDSCTVSITKANIQSYQTAMVNKGFTKGIILFEVTIDACTSSSHIMVGACNGKQNLRQWIGQDKNGWSWFGYSGSKYYGGNCPSYANNAKFGAGDVIGVKLDLRKAGCISFYKNGKSLGPAFTSIAHNGEKIYPAVTLRTTGDKVTLRTGTNMKFETIYAQNRFTA